MTTASARRERNLRGLRQRMAHLSFPYTGQPCPTTPPHASTDPSTANTPRRLAAPRTRSSLARQSVLVCIGVKNVEADGWSGRPTTAAALGGNAVVLAGQGKRVSFEATGIRAESPAGRQRSPSR